MIRFLGDGCCQDKISLICLIRTCFSGKEYGLFDKNFLFCNLAVFVCVYVHKHRLGFVGQSHELFKAQLVIIVLVIKIEPLGTNCGPPAFRSDRMPATGRPQMLLGGPP